MNCRHQIFILCISMITTCQITQGFFIKHLLNNDQTLSGYHLESLSQVQDNYNSNSYMLVPLEQVLTRYSEVGRTNTRTTRSKRLYIPFFKIPYFQNNDATTNTIGNESEDTVKALEIADSMPFAETTNIHTVDPKTRRVRPFTEPKVSISNKNIDDLDHTMVTVHPYLLLVYKVTKDIIPDLTPSQILYLSLKVAKMTTEALKNYEKENSLIEVTKVDAKLADDTVLNKRDTAVSMIEVDDVTDPNTIDSTTIKRYASNIYEKLKTVFKSSFLNDPLSFFSHVNSSPDKKNIVNDDRNVIYIDKTRFDELLKKSMTYQPNFINDNDGQKLVEYLKSMKLKISPLTMIDSQKSFEDLTSKMDFNENVTPDQINELVNILSKITDYFIAVAIRDKRLANQG